MKLRRPLSTPQESEAINSHKERRLSSIKSKKNRFANVDELLALTGLVPGAVPPFGEPIFKLPLFVDPSLLENEKISFNAGSLTNSITMKLEDYLKVANPVVFEFVE